MILITCISLGNKLSGQKITGRYTSSPMLAFTYVHGLRKMVPGPGLPDDIYIYQQTKKSQFGYTFVGLVIENAGIFYVYGNWAYFIAIWNILWSFGIFCGHLEYFMVIWNILWSFGTFFAILVCFAKKHLATLSPPQLSHLRMCKSVARRNFSCVG
jgi:hypothetical protein